MLSLYYIITFWFDIEFSLMGDVTMTFSVPSTIKTLPEDIVGKDRMQVKTC